jgi:hypothetical protein
MASSPTGLSRIVRDLVPETPTAPAIPTLDGPAHAAVVKIVELQLRQVPLDTLTADVLPAMLEIFDAPAGALLLYRREDATLTLAAARGLAVSAAEALDVLRWGDERSSEMPLRALVDRKIYVVERPSDDPFTRQLVDPDARKQVGSVATVPLYRWQLPVGILLLLGGEAPLEPESLLAPAFTYSVLALGISNLLWARDDRGATPLPAPDTAPPPLICVPWVDQRELHGEVTRLARERDAAVAKVQAEGRAALEAGVAAARVESRSALESMLQELRAAVTNMEAERHATAQERAALTERLSSFEQEHGRLVEKLATAEQDRSTLVTRLASLETIMTRAPEPTAASTPEPPAAAAATPSPASSPTSAASAPPPPPVPARTAEAPAAAAAPAATPSPAQAQRRVLERNATLRDHIQTALTSAIPAGRGSVVAVNLLDCDAATLEQLGEIATTEPGALVVGYAAHAERGSRILGPLRCFGTPPGAAEITAALEGANRGNRRTILLSEDIDAFMVAKTALTKSGHSVSMACDEKQALDLLAILRPDTVLVDVRGKGVPAVEFLDALGPENGRILTLLVHGDPTGAALARLAERMLRSSALDVNELVKVCRNALPENKRPGAAPARPGAR